MLFWEERNGFDRLQCTNGETCIQGFSTQRKHYWLQQCISNQTDESTLKYILGEGAEIKK